MATIKLAPTTLFLATPISNKHPSELLRLKSIIETIEGAATVRGVKTFCALREEGWKADPNPGIVMRDLNWVRSCTGAILIPGDSHGVRIEEGWLSAFQKPILRLHDGVLDIRSALEAHLRQIVPVFDRVFTEVAQLPGFVDEFIGFLQAIK
ncbi:Uncharacterised protein [Candidatus Bilamarchaeum dharawalense]|uniref:Nucleoside 2-deoxyribosyltransferase n=1 Tax=Candidatus Bilamarchaeum dharawalense TaxID=2885759 RepID=A0A5E4LRW2_9ARCH|nr:Uncharacterised protein [Candidatus Bilamarchaeum dharawalense]